jgi:hypothetical protein
MNPTTGVSEWDKVRGLVAKYKAPIVVAIIIQSAVPFLLLLTEVSIIPSLRYSTLITIIGISPVYVFLLLVLLIDPRRWIVFQDRNSWFVVMYIVSIIVSVCIIVALTATMWLIVAAMLVAFGPILLFLRMGKVGMLPRKWTLSRLAFMSPFVLSMVGIGLVSAATYLFVTDVSADECINDGKLGQVGGVETNMSCANLALTSIKDYKESKSSALLRAFVSESPSSSDSQYSGGPATEEANQKESEGSHEREAELRPGSMGVLASAHGGVSSVMAGISVVYAIFFLGGARLLRTPDKFDAQEDDLSSRERLRILSMSQVSLICAMVSILSAFAWIQPLPESQINADSPLHSLFASGTALGATSQSLVTSINSHEERHAISVDMESTRQLMFADSLMKVLNSELRTAYTVSDSLTIGISRLAGVLGRARSPSSHQDAISLHGNAGSTQDRELAQAVADVNANIQAFNVLVSEFLGTSRVIDLDYLNALDGQLKVLGSRLESLDTRIGRYP